MACVMQFRAHLRVNKQTRGTMTNKQQYMDIHYGQDGMECLCDVCIRCGGCVGR